MGYVGKASRASSAANKPFCLKFEPLLVFPKLAVETGDTATSLDIVGAVYDLDLTTATVTEPVGIGSLLTAFFS